MGDRMADRVIHSYHLGRHQVLCGCREQTNSTKHAGAVTCLTCRELLARASARDLLAPAPVVDRPAGPAADPAE
jgi:hypothetical protein